MLRFNIRVYGLLIQNEKVLITDELIGGKKITKFPGGGLEYGEGTVACLKREFIEELNLEIEIINHFYTTDFFVPSVFDDSQIISIYYQVKKRTHEEIKTSLESNTIQGFRWIELRKINPNNFTFPIDKKVAELLLNKRLHKLE